MPSIVYAVYSDSYPHLKRIITPYKRLHHMMLAFNAVSMAMSRPTSRLARHRRKMTVYPVPS